MATVVSAGAATAAVRGAVGLWSCAASVITLLEVAAAKSEFMVDDHTDAAFLYATLIFRRLAMLSLVFLQGPKTATSKDWSL